MNAAAAVRTRDIRIMSMVGIAHWFSHFYQLVLPPLFVLIGADLGISYTRLGLLVGVFYVTSGILQTPAGFLVDRFGAARMLLGGLALLAAATFGLGFAPTYETILVLTFLGGIGNSVFHPADYAILSGTVSDQRMGRAFSIHSVGGHLGYAAAPAAMIALGSILGWRGALIAAGLAGVIPILIMYMYLETKEQADDEAKQQSSDFTFASGAKLLLQGPMLFMFVFFVLFSMSLIGLQSFTPTALVKLRDVPLAMANVALAGFLAGAPVGIIAGGIIADKIKRHSAMATGSIIISAATILGFALLQPPVGGLVLTLFFAGFWFGLALPSRDLVVRSVAPPGATGKVFGFVYSGLDVGAAISPVLFGWFVDIGHPLWIFLFAPAFMVMSAGVILMSERQGRRAGRGSAPG